VETSANTKEPSGKNGKNKGQNARGRIRVQKDRAARGEKRIHLEQGGERKERKGGEKRE